LKPFVWVGERYTRPNQQCSLNELKGARMSTPPSRPEPVVVVDKSELFELLIESATDFAIFSMDTEGIVTSWNSGAERLLGYRADEIIGASGDKIFTPEDQSLRVPGEERRQASVAGRALDDRWTMRKDGTRFFASGLMMPLADRSRGFVKIFRDLTEQHRVQSLLRENEERFRLLATNIPQLVFRTQPDGMRTWGSPQWIEFTGLSLPESLQLGWLDAVHPDDRAATQAAWEPARRNREYYIEHRVLRAEDGEYRWHQTRARPVEGGTPAERAEWVGTMTDVHDLRGLKDRQQVMLAELQHRTRNLLAVVKSIASQTIRKSDSLAAFRNVFENRLGALGRVQGLISRIDYQDVDLQTLVSSELAVHGDGGEDGDKIVIAGPFVALPATSAQALALALHELATNAVKYGAFASDKGRLKVTWDFDSSEDERRIVLVWRETGVSLPFNGSPPRKGFGSELIQRALPYQLQAKTKLEFLQEGVCCTIIAPVKARENENGGASIRSPQRPAVPACRGRICGGRRSGSDA
jgi:PAS domain S-box-containing protein